MTLNLPLGPGTWWGIPRRCRPPDWGVSLWRWNHSAAGRYPVKDIFTLWMCMSTALKSWIMMVVKILILCTFVNTERNFLKYHRVFPMLLKKEPPWMEYLTSSGLGEPRLGTNLGGENRVGCLGRCFCWNADSGIVSWGSTLCHGNSSVLVLFHNEQYNKTKILNISNSLWKTRKIF